jgi:hypothetical protein
MVFTSRRVLVRFGRLVRTTRAVDWATGALSWDDTTVSALARQLGVDWHRPVNTRPQGRLRQRRAATRR